MSGDPYTRRSESRHRTLPSITVILCRDIGDDSPTWANHKKSCQPVIYRTNQHGILDDHEKDQVPESGYDDSRNVYVNPGVTRRMLGASKPESDTIRNVLFHQVAENVDFQVRFHLEPNSISFWDNRVSTVSTQRRA
ncbi:hypothetical protein P692DRAFT_201795894 [Suillus brevipes Sb2]|nr:hypothetical protein P692DRAFT_201795894 [Suillus brevipes Sb2]